MTFSIKNNVAFLSGRTLRIVSTVLALSFHQATHADPEYNKIDHGQQHVDTVRLIFTPPSISSIQAAVKSDSLVTNNQGIQWSLSEMGLTTKDLIKGKGAYSFIVRDVPLKGLSPEELAQFLTNTGLFGTVELDYMVTEETNPVRATDNEAGPEPLVERFNDPSVDMQSYLLPMSENNPDGMNVTGMWDKYTADLPKISIAVLDSSFFTNSEVVFAQGASFTRVAGQIYSDDFGPRDDEEHVANNCSGHGLSVSSVIAGTKNNEKAGVGITNDVFIHPVRVMDCGSGFLSDTARAIEWLTGIPFEGVTLYSGNVGIINMSLGASTATCPNYMQRAVDMALAQGWTLVAAAGNQGISAAQRTPANCDGVITVGAIEEAGNLAPFSNFGEGVDIVAHGDKAVTVCLHDQDESAELGCLSNGTSYAAPFVSGILGSIKQQVSADDFTLKSALSITAQQPMLKTECETKGCGAGVIDANNMLDFINLSRNGELDTIEYALLHENSCDADWMAEHFGHKAPLCDLFKVTFLGGFANELQHFELYRIAKGEALTLENGAEFVEGFEADVAYITGVDAESYDYGFRLCEEGICESALRSLTTSSISEFNLPLGCN